MFGDYQDAVLKAYHQKKSANKIPLDMRQLSPARFRAACEEVCSRDYHKKDERVLTAFFKHGADREACLKAIKGCDIDIFRPLIYLLKQKTTSTADEKNIELLAWMIGFQPRPYDERVDYKSIQLEISPPQEYRKTNPIPPKPTPPSGKRRKFVLTITITVALAASVTWTITRQSAAPRLTGNERCMYWAEDHYQPISCSQKIENSQVIALDSEMVVHFKKITRPDTITAKAIGSVWYVRYRGNYEYYTDSGFHPIDPTLRLKKLTDWIIQHHVPATP